jgi:RimJ/RimL family protein N-acetyltransferase
MTPPLATDRLALTPLSPADAPSMVAVLADPALYRFTGGEPPDSARLAARYEAQCAGPPDPGERWHNWIVRPAGSPEPLGYVQATVTGDHADVAWVLGTEAQGHGYAREAAAAMCAWLRGQGAARLTAHIHPDHHASAGVARAAGLRPTGVVDDDGEQVWTSDPA